MEIFDVVNKKDKVIGQATREECHSNPKLIHRTVHFTLIDVKKKKILITQRAFGLKTDPGKWCFLGEHMLAGENFRQGLTRGLAEELGLKLSHCKEVGHRIVYSPNQTEFIRFFVVKWDGNKISPDSEEIIELKWPCPEDLLKENRDYSDITRRWIESTDWHEMLQEWK